MESEKLIDKFKKWHDEGTHEWDSNCSCSRCGTIVDAFLEQWRDGEITHEMIGDWYLGHDYVYDIGDTFIEYTNKLNYKTAEFSVGVDNSEFGIIFLQAKKFGYSEA